MVKIEILIKHDKICNMYYQIFFLPSIFSCNRGLILVRKENRKKILFLKCNVKR